MTKSRSYQTFFSPFFFFGVKLGHFSIKKKFSVCNKNASLPAKKKKNSSLLKKKSLEGSTLGLTQNRYLILLYSVIYFEFFKAEDSNCQ